MKDKEVVNFKGIDKSFFVNIKFNYFSSQIKV